MTFAQLWNEAVEHNINLDNPFVNPSDEIVKEINEFREWNHSSNAEK